MYKYPIMKQLKYWLDEGMLSPDLDLTEVLAFWMANHDKPKRVRKPSNKPRFYYRAQTANSRAKAKGDHNKLTSDDLEMVYARDNGKCKRCGITEHLVFDHIKPYYRGGTNTADNLQLLCKLCNMEKGVN